MRGASRTSRLVGSIGGPNLRPTHLAAGPTGPPPRPRCGTDLPDSWKIRDPTRRCSKLLLSCGHLCSRGVKKPLVLLSNFNLDILVGQVPADTWLTPEVSRVAAVLLSS